MPVCPKCHEENPQLGARCPRDGHYFIPKASLVDAKKDPMIGSIAADKYVILGLISEGGMGAVYRALQLPVEREVALKVLRTELQDSDQGRDRFILEARAVSRLSHPNIITLHDFGFDSQQHPYMVMEYAPGKSLARWLRDDITLDRIVHVMKQVLSALSEAHDRGIVHRDLKPENMIVTKAGADRDYVKLLDFGIARMINEGSTRKLTREGEVFGTPHYMAPEQAQGKKNVGPPADVYACGIILWELICGHCPFDAPTPLAVLFMHINEEIPELEPRPGMTVPKEIRDVLTRATQKQALSRYQHAGEMLGALTKAAEAAKSNQQAAAAAAPKPDRKKKKPTPQPSSSGFDPSKPISLASRAEASQSSNDLPVFDPEPSMEQPGLNARRSSSPGTNPNLTPKATNPPEEDQAKLKLSIAALAILIVFAGVLVFSVFIFGGEETAEAEASEVVEVEDENATDENDDHNASEKDKTGPAVAAKSEKDAKKPAEDKVETTTTKTPEETLPTSMKDPVDPAKVAGHSPPGEDPINQDTPDEPETTKPANVEPKVEPKKVEPKKVEPKKVEPKTTVSTKPEPKKTTKTSDDSKSSDEKDEPKKFEPKAFEAPPPTKWK